MRYPKLIPPKKRRVSVDRFRGYSHTPEPGAGAFYDMQNLSDEAAPLLRTRRRRTEPRTLDGCPAGRVLAVGGRGQTVVLDADGTLWCGGAALPRLLDGTVSLNAYDGEDSAAALPQPERILNTLTSPGDYRYRYEASADRWRPLDGGASLEGSLLIRNKTEQELSLGSAVLMADGVATHTSWNVSTITPSIWKKVFS